ncbi:hypothetical protein C4K03_2397 [Pseudomonas synxantha]|uniref:Uncharacterized protein n=1 Tax=Pseudomonas synxantha TaxID=47883 RepID=A0A3G7U789_9PSED|nr:hypothetical protein C4K03_2397 [Pseudomonas synxantha]
MSTSNPDGAKKMLISPKGPDGWTLKGMRDRAILAVLL